MRRVKAFTLFETLIVINLSVFLFMILFFTHRVVIQHSSSVENSTLDSIFEIKKQLEINFEQSISIVTGGADLVFNYPKDSIVYSFGKNSIKKNLNLIYEGTFDYQIDENSSINVVDFLEMRFWVNEKEVRLNFVKEYSPFFVLNHKELSFDY